MAIVPSIMMLFGKANWWFPAWLDRILPKLSVDADDLDAHVSEDPEPSPARAGRNPQVSAATRPRHRAAATGRSYQA